MTTIVREGWVPDTRPDIPTVRDLFADGPTPIHDQTVADLGDPAGVSAGFDKRLAEADAFINATMHPWPMLRVTPIAPRIFDAPHDDWCNHCEGFIHTGDAVYADTWGGFTHAAHADDAQVSA